MNTSILFATLATLLFLLNLHVQSASAISVILYSSPVLSFAGIVFAAFGFIMSILSSLSLGDSWRIGVNADEKTRLVTSGAYRFSRNPYFLSYDFFLAGIVLYSTTLLLAVSAGITILLFHLMILNEEKYLASVHGEEYLAYKRQVRRYI